MNNASLYSEEDEEEVVRLDSSLEEARLQRLIEAVDILLQTREWNTLQELHFGREEERIKRLLFNEAQKSTVDDKAMYRLQGELIWATRYSDIKAWAIQLTNQLSTLKKR